MKNYFKFNLTGKKLLPIWLLFLVLVVVPYIYVQVQNSLNKHADPSEQLTTSLQFLGAILVILVIRYAITFFIAKMSIDNIEIKQNPMSFNGEFGQFMWKMLSGLFLSIITIGIYSPWFVKNICDFFAKNTTVDSNKFEFNGKAGNLFKIITLTLILPMIIIMGVIIGIGVKNKLQGAVSNTTGDMVSILMVAAIFIIMIPYMYHIYKWMVNIKFKNFLIQWETNFWNSCGKIAIEMLLSIITIGIYSPLASLRLYQYFAERTVAVSDNRKKIFGYDIEPSNDLLFIWGQILLTIITLGVYYSWAYCKIGNRIMCKTYTMDVTIAE